MSKLIPYKSKVIATLSLETYEDHSGLFIPTKEIMREYMKKKEVRTIDENYDLHIREGKVVAVADECTQIRVGDSIVFNRHNGDEFDFEGEHYICLPEELVAAVHRQ